MISSILKSLDLTEEESQAYLHLLENGKTTAGTLAKQTTIPRPTLYGLLGRLHQMGLVNQTINMDGVKVFSAEPPEKINILFDQKIENLQKQQTQYQGLLEELRVNSAASFSNPKFQLFEGQEGIQNVLKDMLLYRNIETYSFWPIQTMIEMLSPDFFRYLNKERIRSNLYTKAIWPASQVVNTSEYPYLGGSEGFLREIRVAPKGVDFSMGYWVYANKAAFISSKREGVGFIIESTEMAEMLLAQHKVIWELSKPLVTDSKAGKEFLGEIKK